MLTVYGVDALREPGDDSGRNQAEALREALPLKPVGTTSCEVKTIEPAQSLGRAAFAVALHLLQLEVGQGLAASHATGGYEQCGSCRRRGGLAQSRELGLSAGLPGGQSRARPRTVKQEESCVPRARALALAALRSQGKSQLRHPKMR